MTEAGTAQELGPYRWITLREDGAVAWIALNDPASLNALSAAMVEEIHAALDAIEHEGRIRCLVLTGTGRAFSSGANLAQPEIKPGQGEEQPDLGTVLEEVYNPLVLRLRDLPLPLITAVNGVCAGVTMSVALMADIVLAARSAYFLQPFARIGVLPDGGASYLLPRLVGRARALELALLAEKLPAEQALAWGLINAVHDDARLMAEAAALAARLAEGPTATYRLIRRAFWEGLDNDFASQLRLERDLQSAAGRTADYREGVRAFLEKRPARFTGR
jgi:2-(1,2-epoxy-1,2-dihydrophenyl)acetyl-CoA isomerase